jgi:AraC family transcriptional regulator
MNSYGITLDLKVKLLNVSKCELDSSWNYLDLVSHFPRIYLIESGEGYIYPNNKKIKLEPGFLYLIPSNIPCSYTCPESLIQHYLHFMPELTDQLNIFDIYPYHFKVEACKNDFRLFDRLIEINPEAALRVSDPAVYHNKSWVNSTSNNSSFSQHIETNGLILQLFSRFLKNDAPGNAFNTKPVSRFREVQTFIRNNIDKNISINELAAQFQMSADHFTRAFKKETGTKPLEYINQKRIEKAKLLLVVSSLSVNEILVKTGFNSASYFIRIFKTTAGLTPLEYRKFHHLLHRKFYSNEPKRSFSIEKNDEIG